MIPPRRRIPLSLQRAAELVSEEAQRKKREAACLEAGKQAYEQHLGPPLIPYTPCSC